MPTEMKLANECVDCLTAYVRNRVAQDGEQERGGTSVTHATHHVDYICDDSPADRRPIGWDRGARPVEQDPQGVLASVNSMMAARKARLKYFDNDLFFDPTWAMLLDLYRSELVGKPLCVSSLCLGSGVPSTTALRYLRILEERGYVERASDEFDRRRSFIRLSSRARDAMASYVDALKSSGGLRKSYR